MIVDRIAGLRKNKQNKTKQKLSLNSLFSLFFFPLCFHSILGFFLYSISAIDWKEENSFTNLPVSSADNNLKDSDSEDSNKDFTSCRCVERSREGFLLLAQLAIPVLLLTQFALSVLLFAQLAVQTGSFYSNIESDFKSERYREVIYIYLPRRRTYTRVCISTSNSASHKPLQLQLQEISIPFQSQSQSSSGRRKTKTKANCPFEQENRKTIKLYKFENLGIFIIFQNATSYPEEKI